MAGNDLRAQFGIRLTALREERRWSQKELASKLRIDVGTLSRQERGEAWPRIEELFALRAVLGVTLDFLLLGEGGYVSDRDFGRLLPAALTQLPRELRDAFERGLAAVLGAMLEYLLAGEAPESADRYSRRLQAALAQLPQELREALVRSAPAQEAVLIRSHSEDHR